MFISLFTYKRIITEDLLILCWKLLKDTYSSFHFTNIKFQPISKSWFSNVVDLINRGCFLYQDNNFIVFRKFHPGRRILNTLKFRTIELAFFFLLKSLFKSSLINTNFTLTEYVRIYIRLFSYYVVLIPCEFLLSVVPYFAWKDNFELYFYFWSLMSTVLYFYSNYFSQIIIFSYF